MPKLRKLRKKNEEDTDIDMVPIMNMFLVLIPFLLMSASFIHLKAINTSIPIIEQNSKAINDVNKQSNIKVTIIANIHKNGIKLSAISDSLKIKLKTRIFMIMKYIFGT